jgi:hypothetical protein
LNALGNGRFVYTPSLNLIQGLSSSTYVDPGDPSITYKYYDASTSPLTNEMIAAYITNKESLNEVTIIRDNINTIY